MRACKTTCSLVPGRAVCLWNFCLSLCSQDFSLVWFGFRLAVLGLSHSTWDLVPWPRIEPGPLALGVWCFNNWTTREVVAFMFNSLIFLGIRAPWGGHPWRLWCGSVRSSCRSWMWCWSDLGKAGRDLPSVAASWAQGPRQCPGQCRVTMWGLLISFPGSPSAPGLRRAWSGWRPRVYLLGRLTSRATWLLQSPVVTVTLNLACWPA